MAHERSETVKRADGKWINVFGRGTQGAGQQIPGTGVFDTMEEAVQAARKRSKRTAEAINKSIGNMVGRTERERVER